MIERQQKTVDLLARETGEEKFDAEILFDRRFESVGADAAEAAGADGRARAAAEGEAVTSVSAQTLGRLTGTARRSRPRAAARRRLAPGRPLPYGKALGPVLLLAVWAAGSAAGLIEARNLSAPWTVVTTAGDLIADGRLQSHLGSSAQRAGLGLLFGTAAGLLLALLSGLSRTGEALIDGTVQIKRAIPTLALIPLLILWLGIGETFKVAIIAIVVYIPIYLNTHAALPASTAGTSNSPRRSG